MEVPGTDRVFVADASPASTGSAAPMQMLWLGSLLRPDLVRHEPAASAAGMSWQTGLLEALVDHGAKVRIHGGTPHSAWPQGRALVRAHESELCGGKLQPHMTGYVNLPVVKLFSQHRRLRHRLEGQLRRGWSPRVSFSYNPGLPEALTCRWLQAEHGVPWVCIVAEFPESSDPLISSVRRAALKVYGQYQRTWAEEAAGRVYLSWALFQDDRTLPKFHLDGGIDRLHPPSAPPESGKRVLLFGGSLTALTGVDVLLDAFRSVRDRNLELWIAGRGNLEPQVVEAARHDARIRFFGQLGRDELHRLMQGAHAFINPRPSHLPENRTNFPSKVMEYLSWARPVISTITPGVSPSYRSLLVPVHEETRDGMAEVIERTLSASGDQLRVASDRIRAYIEENLLWSVQSRRLLRWLERESLLG
jgi:glycosyltransferase involved in cell wall biosynthesis